MTLKGPYDRRRPEEATSRFPREIRFIFSLGSLIFVFEYLVLPQFGPARHVTAPARRSVNPVLVTFAVLLEIARHLLLRRAHPHGALPLRPEPLQHAAREHGGPRHQPRRARAAPRPPARLAYRIFNELGVPKETNAFGLAAQGSGSAVVLNLIFWFALVISIPLNGFNPAYGFAALAGVFLLARVLRHDPAHHPGSASR